LTIDNLVEVEIVLASGEVVRASEKENEELFWAVRGAGAAFGVVTEFVYRGHEQRTPVFGGMLIFPVEKLGGVVAFANAFHEKNDGNQTLMFGWSAPHGEPAVLVVFFHNGTKEEGESFFKELVELGPVVNTAREMPYEKLNGMLSDAMGWGGRKIFGGGNFTLPLDVAVVEKLKNEFFGFLDARERMGESALLFECIPYKKVLEVSNSAMAFANRGQYYNVATCFKWYDEALDAEVRAFSRELLTRASEEAGVWKGGRGKGGVGQYANYSTAESKAEELFGGNTGRLLELKGRFDPRNVFSTHRLGTVGEGVVG
jgi:FAD/FMN-containing dehydrogenase